MTEEMLLGELTSNSNLNSEKFKFSSLHVELYKSIGFPKIKRKSKIVDGCYLSTMYLINFFFFIAKVGN